MNIPTNVINYGFNPVTKDFEIGIWFGGAVKIETFDCAEDAEIKIDFLTRDIERAKMDQEYAEWRFRD